MTDTADPTSALCRLCVHRPSQTQSSELKETLRENAPFHRLPSRWPAETYDLNSAADIRIPFAWSLSLSHCAAFADLDHSMRLQDCTRLSRQKSTVIRHKEDGKNVLQKAQQ